MTSVECPDDAAANHCWMRFPAIEAFPPVCGLEAKFYAWAEAVSIDALCRFRVDTVEKLVAGPSSRGPLSG